MGLRQGDTIEKMQARLRAAGVPEVAVLHLAKELEESGLEGHKEVNQRIMERILAIH